ncbi:MAG: hypothetical protein QM608_12005 [Caulobacter sp.]
MAVTDVFQLQNIPGAIVAVGALGTAAFGIVDAVGKLLAGPIWRSDDDRRAKPILGFAGLPYVGYARIQLLMSPLTPALAAVYGADFETLVREQYRNGRQDGLAPGTIRQGAKLGLDLLDEERRQAVIADLLTEDRVSRSGARGATRTAVQVAQAHVAEVSAALARDPASDDLAFDEPGAPDSPALLARERRLAQFAIALDLRVSAAFSLAEARYTAAARGWAALAAVLLALACSLSFFPWTLPNIALALFAGVVAVPLAPVAHELAKSISDGVAAFQSFRRAR